MKLNKKRASLLLIAMITGAIAINNYIKIIGILMHGTINQLLAPIIFVTICTLTSIVAISKLEEDLDNKRK